MGGLVYSPLHFVDKDLNTLGRIARSYELYIGKENFYYPNGICFRGLHRKKIVLRWNDTPFVPLWDQINRE